MKDPKDFYILETSVKSSAESFSAGFLSCVLSEMDAWLCKDAWRLFTGCDPNSLRDERPL